MYNILIASGIALAAYCLGAWVAGWIAGFVPALLALVIAWVLLARRTGRQVEVVVKAAMTVLQAGKVDEARAMLEAALPLGKWQILVAQQIHGQIGALDYIQAVGLGVQRQLTAAKAKYAVARDHLEKSWSRDWRSRALLAALHHREGRPDDAVKVLEGATAGGKKEAIFWGLYGFVLNEARKRDEALQVVGRGLRELPDAGPLKEMQEAMSNRKRPSMRVFGDGWYQFFPEDIPQEQLRQMQGANSQPKPRPQKTWPQPRR